MFTRVLVPIDFSPPSDAALAYAQTLAGTFGSALHLLHIVENEFLRPMTSDSQAVEAATLMRIQNRMTAEDYRRFRVLPVIEQSDEPADAIISYARAQAIDLIVMGTHGRTGMAHVLVGSVAEKVVRTAPCSVLTLREAPSRGTDASPTRILVATDFSAAADSALACARVVAARSGASLHLLHVLDEALVNGPLGSEIYVAESSDSRTARLKDAQERLAHRTTAEDRERLHATTEVRIFGSIASTIVEYAADNTCDLIVMGTHGRTGMAHLLIGSVAETVVRTAPCPVLSTHHLRDVAVAPVIEGRAVPAER